MWQLSKDNQLHVSGWTGIVMAVLAVLLAFQADAGPPDAEVLPPGVSVRQAPTAASPIVGELSAGAQVEVLFTQNGPAGNWAQVVLPSGRTGFVPDSSLRRLNSPLAWRSAGPGSSAPTTTRRAGEGALDIPLRRVGGVFLVTARINSQITTNFIVDSGASIVTISHALADQLGLDYESKPKQKIATASGFMDSPRITIDSICVPDEGGAGVANVEAHVATLPGSLQAIGGLLGQTFLRHFQVTIDAERAVMHLRPTRQ
jgi:clan AA aspartic protease (TIGR02281 family)